MSNLRPVAPLPDRITIADVAREAGVSKATVSRFLNHRDTLLTRTALGMLVAIFGAGARHLRATVSFPPSSAAAWRQRSAPCR